MISLIFLLSVFYRMFREFEDKSILNGWKKEYKFLGVTIQKSWLNSGESWKNKWKLDADGNLIKYDRKDWWYFGIYPKYQERFTYSSTIFVWMTDAEHLFQTIQILIFHTIPFLWDWRLGVAAIVGTYLFTFVKERFLKQLR